MKTNKNTYPLIEITESETEILLSSYIRKRHTDGKYYCKQIVAVRDLSKNTKNKIFADYMVLMDFNVKNRDIFLSDKQEISWEIDNDQRSEELRHLIDFPLTIGGFVRKKESTIEEHKRYAAKIILQRLKLHNQIMISEALELADGDDVLLGEINDMQGSAPFLQPTGSI